MLIKEKYFKTKNMDEIEIQTKKNETTFIDEENDYKKVEVESQRLTELRQASELKNLNSTFNSFSSKKAYATGLLDLALITTNFAQLKQLIQSKKSAQWEVLDIIVIICVCFSLLLQFLCGAVLVFSAKQFEFTDENKRDASVKLNNMLTLLILVITILNIFINVFLSI